MSNVMTPKFRVSFANVFRPGRPLQEGAPPKYGLTMLFDAGTDLNELKKAAEQAVKDKWGDKPPKLLRSPFRDQGEKEFEGYVEGAVFINATSQQKPGLVDENVQSIIDESEFYSGCYARATIRAFAYDKGGNRGVAFGLQNVQKLADGDPLGGRTPASADFEPVSENAGGSDATSMFG